MLGLKRNGIASCKGPRKREDMPHDEDRTARELILQRNPAYVPALCHRLRATHHPVEAAQLLVEAVARREEAKRVDKLALLPDETGKEATAKCSVRVEQPKCQFAVDLPLHALGKYHLPSRALNDVINGYEHAGHGAQPHVIAQGVERPSKGVQHREMRLKEFKGVVYKTGGVHSYHWVSRKGKSRFRCCQSKSKSLRRTPQQNEKGQAIVRSARGNRTVTSPTSSKPKPTTGTNLIMW